MTMHVVSGSREQPQTEALRTAPSSIVCMRIVQLIRVREGECSNQKGSRMRDSSSVSRGRPYHGCPVDVISTMLHFCSL